MKQRHLIASSTPIAAQQAIAQSALDASQANFKKSIAETEETFRRDQRGWVGPMDGAPPPYTEGGKQVYIKIAEKPRFAITVINSGKTPALKMRSIVAVWAYHSSEKFVPFYRQYNSISTVQTLFPGERAILSTRSDLPDVSGLQINGLLSGEYIYYVYGKITYEDVFKRPHKTTFCVYLARDFTFLTNCGTYNDAD